MLIAMTGLSGTGKSTLSRALAQRLNGLVLDKDVVRAALFSPKEVDYSTEQNDLVVQIIFQVAEYLLKKDPQRVIILDGRPYSRRYQMDALRSFAARIENPLYIIECVAPDAVIRARLEKDQREGTHLAADRDYAMYQRVKAQAEPIDPPKWVLDTSETDLETCVQQVLDYLNNKAG